MLACTVVSGAGRRDDRRRGAQIDAANGKITLKHGPTTNLDTSGWIDSRIFLLLETPRFLVLDLIETCGRCGVLPV